MGQQEKSSLYQALKAAGAEFPKPYREFTVDELQRNYDRYVENGLIEPEPEVLIPLPAAPMAERDPEEMAGMRLNTKAPDEPLRTDPETGFVWYQEEVLKPGYAKPRGRRILKYNDPGSQSITQTDNQGATESFEIAGNRVREAEARITLPSYQVGVYRDPRMPFKIHVYNETRGFDLFEVEEFWNGPDLVPEGVQRMYVENVLCYDIRTVVREIEAEHRRLQLAGKVD